LGCSFYEAKTYTYSTIILKKQRCGNSTNVAPAIDCMSAYLRRVINCGLVLFSHLCDNSAFIAGAAFVQCWQVVPTKVRPTTRRSGDVLGQAHAHELPSLPPGFENTGKPVDSKISIFYNVSFADSKIFEVLLTSEIVCLHVTGRWKKMFGITRYSFHY
jgi:hypothetical protein